MKMQKYNVFVYGTLMKGFSNYKHYLEGRSNVKFLGMAKVEGYSMYHVSYFPGIVPDKGESILGEVYQVDEKLLRQLDILEAEGHMYIRQKESAYLDTGEKIDVYLYVWNLPVKENCKKVEMMPWRPL
jgi:gamma-glutamylcyclotransferase (GGCT)/AIG2-like uncharacterized protein YtfP